MDEKVITMKEHLLELRKRIIISAVFFVFTTILSFIFVQGISAFLVHIAGDIEIISISPTEAFTTEIRIALFAGFLLALPVILIEVIAFIAPGLKTHERSKFIFIFLFSLSLFALGIFFAYTIALPFTIKFLSNFSPNVSALFSYQSYISFITSLVLLFGVVFQLPLIIMILVVTGLVQVTTLKSIRKYMIVIMFIVAAIITPPDVVSQLVMVGPLIIMYEAGVLLGQIFRSKKMRQLDQ